MSNLTLSKYFATDSNSVATTVLLLELGIDELYFYVVPMNDVSMKLDVSANYLEISTSSSVLYRYKPNDRVLGEEKSTASAAYFSIIAYIYG
jgi:hypothetical protein